MSDDNPENWRATVDPNTGRTYWYHRISRLSTWVRPSCLGGSDSDEDDFPLQNNHESEWSQSRRNLSKLLDGLDFDPETIIKRLSCGTDEDKNQYTKLLFASCTPNTLAAWVENDQIMINLISNTIQATLDSLRQTSLHILWTFAVNTKVATVFHSNQTWAALARFTAIWDFQSSFYFTYMIALLTRGPAKAVITRELTLYLERWLENVCDTEKSVHPIDIEKLATHPAMGGITMLHMPVLNILCTSACNGCTLSGIVLTYLLSQAFRNEKFAVPLLRTGAFAALQRICSSQLTPPIVQMRAKSTILAAMAASSYVRERMLDSWQDVAAGLYGTAKPSGKHPWPLDTVHVTDVSEDEAGEGIGSEDEADALEAERELEQDPLPHFDVKLRPGSGAAWRVSSIVLWARCPGLRQVLMDHWLDMAHPIDSEEEEQALPDGLDMSVDADAAVLTCVMQFVHTGAFVPPSSPASRLEIVKIANELGMPALRKMAVEAVHQQLTRETVDQALQFAAKWSVADLERVALTYQSSGRRPTIRFNPGGDGGGSSSSSSLKDAIYSNLQDVSALLAADNAPAAATTATATATATSSSRKPMTKVVDLSELAGPSGREASPGSHSGSSTLPGDDSRRAELVAISSDETYAAYRVLQDESYNSYPLDSNTYSARQSNGRGNVGHSGTGTGSGAGSSSNSSSSGTKKPKSGGIYSLLLEGAGIAGGIELDWDEGSGMLGGGDGLGGDRIRAGGKGSTTGKTSQPHRVMGSKVPGRVPDSRSSVTSSMGARTANGKKPPLPANGPAAGPGGHGSGRVGRGGAGAGAGPGVKKTVADSGKRLSADMRQHPQQMTGGGGGNRNSQESPRTARATALLAGARPGPTVGNVSDSDFDENTEGELELELEHDNDPSGEIEGVFTEEPGGYDGGAGLSRRDDGLFQLRDLDFQQEDGRDDYGEEGGDGDAYESSFDDKKEDHDTSALYFDELDTSFDTLLNQTRRKVEGAAKAYNTPVKAAPTGVGGGGRGGPRGGNSKPQPQQPTGAVEFAQGMSLVPPVEMTPAEKRLAEMARPRKVVTSPGKKGKKDASDEHEEDEGQTDTVEGDGAMSAVNLDKKLKPARSLPEKDVTATTTSTAITAAATAASGDISSRGGAHANGVGKSEESVGPMGSKQSVPRRAVSPDTTSTVVRRSSTVGSSSHSMNFVGDKTEAGGTAGEAGTAGSTHEEPMKVEPAARSSLLLLKNRVKGRRRTAAEVERDAAAEGAMEQDEGVYSPRAHMGGARTSSLSPPPHSDNRRSSASVAPQSAAVATVVSVDLSTMVPNGRAVGVGAGRGVAVGMGVGVRASGAAAAAVAGQGNRSRGPGSQPQPLRAYVDDSDAADGDDGYDGGGFDVYNQQHHRSGVERSRHSRTSRDEYVEEGVDEGMGEGDEDVGLQPTHQCPDCSRKFFEGPFAKHVKICAKVFLQKRKKFDSSNMRVQAIPELKELMSTTTKKSAARSRQQQQQQREQKEQQQNSGRWKEQSNAFREAMRAAREVTQAIATGAPLPPPTTSAPDPSLKPCPHCGRRFSDKAAERHIPQCQNIKAKPSTLKRGGGTTAGNGVGKAPVKGSNLGGRAW